MTLLPATTPLPSELATLKMVQGFPLECQGWNLALTVVYVPYSLDKGTRGALCLPHQPWAFEPCPVIDMNLWTLNPESSSRYSVGLQFLNRQRTESTWRRTMRRANSQTDFHRLRSVKNDRDGGIVPHEAIHANIFMIQSLDYADKHVKSVRHQPAQWAVT